MCPSAKVGGNQESVDFLCRGGRSKWCIDAVFELRTGCMQEVQDINVSDGMLSVTVLEAKHIPKGDFFTESNPYIA